MELPRQIRLVLVIDTDRHWEDHERESLERLWAIVERGDSEALAKFVAEEPDWFWALAGLEKG